MLTDAARVAIAFLLIFLTSQTASGKEAVPGSASWLMVSAAPARSEFRTGEPIYVIMTIRNVTRDPVWIGMLVGASGHYELEVENEQHVPLRPPEPVRSPGYVGPIVRLRMGSARAFTIEPQSVLEEGLNVSPEYCSITEPGTYFVRAKLLAGPMVNPLVSNWTTIRVVDPDRAAAALPGPDGIELTVSPLIKEIPLGGRAIFDLMLQNLSGKPIRIGDSAYWQYDMEIETPDGRALEPTDYEQRLRSSWLNEFPRGKLNLREDAKIFHQETVTDRYAFTRPGKYVIHFYRNDLGSDGTEHTIRATRPVELTIR